jgi:hypothetical protein
MFRQIDLHSTICNGINLRERKDQTMLEDMVSPFGCTVNVFEGNDGNLATATKKTK